MNQPIRKAVFPVAGLGTRMFPATKAIPKEMLTIVDRPIIEHVVEEAREAGIEQFVFVTGRNKSAIEDHFDTNIELDQAFARKGSIRELDELQRRLPEAGSMTFTRQQRPLGLGHAVWCARHAIGNEPFALLLPDMIMKSNPGCLAQMMRVYDERGGNIIATEAVSPAEVNRYGILDLKAAAGAVNAIQGMIEKPTPELAPSNFSISGRYILQPEIFDILSAQRPGSGGEIQLTDALIKLLGSQRFWAFKFEGETFDCGDRMGFLLANVAMGLSHNEIGFRFRRQLLAMLGQERNVPDAEKARRVAVVPHAQPQGDMPIQRPLIV
jgi:UTP--glucose-1-phosphate uridylyltransferase